MAMITLKCKHCDASLEREPGVGLVDAKSGDLGGTYDICPEAPSGLDDPHKAVRLLVISVPAKVAVDVDAWRLAYGHWSIEDVPGDVRDYALERLRSMVTDELFIRDVTVRGA